MLIFIFILNNSGRGEKKKQASGLCSPTRDGSIENYYLSACFSLFCFFKKEDEPQMLEIFHLFIYVRIYEHI